MSELQIRPKLSLKRVSLFFVKIQLKQWSIDTKLELKIQCNFSLMAENSKHCNDDVIVLVLFSLCGQQQKADNLLFIFVFPHVKGSAPRF